MVGFRSECASNKSPGSAEATGWAFAMLSPRGNGPSARFWKRSRSLRTRTANAMKKIKGQGCFGSAGVPSRRPRNKTSPTIYKQTAARVFRCLKKGSPGLREVRVSTTRRGTAGIYDEEKRNHWLLGWGWGMGGSVGWREGCFRRRTKTTRSQRSTDLVPNISDPHPKLERTKRLVGGARTGLTRWRAEGSRSRVRTRRTTGGDWCSSARSAGRGEGEGGRDEHSRARGVS